MHGDDDERADTTVGVEFGSSLPQELVVLLLAKLRELHSSRDCAGIATWNPRLGLHFDLGRIRCTVCGVSLSRNLETRYGLAQQAICR